MNEPIAYLFSLILMAGVSAVFLSLIAIGNAARTDEFEQHRKAMARHGRAGRGKNS